MTKCPLTYQEALDLAAKMKNNGGTPPTVRCLRKTALRLMRGLPVLTPWRSWRKIQ